MQGKGTFLLYARAINIKILPGLSAIASEHNAPTKNTIKQVTQFLDYYKYQEEAIITVNVSVMVMEIHFNASYLSKKNARSRAGGHNFL